MVGERRKFYFLSLPFPKSKMLQIKNGEVYFGYVKNIPGLPWWLSGKKKKIHLPNVGDTRFNPRVGKLPRATEQLSPHSTLLS